MADGISPSAFARRRKMLAHLILLLLIVLIADVSVKINFKK